MCTKQVDIFLAYVSPILRLWIGYGMKLDFLAGFSGRLFRLSDAYTSEDVACILRDTFLGLGLVLACFVIPILDLQACFLLAWQSLSKI